MPFDFNNQAQFQNQNVTPQLLGTALGAYLQARGPQTPAHTLTPDQFVNGMPPPSLGPTNANAAMQQFMPQQTPFQSQMLASPSSLMNPPTNPGMIGGM